MGKTAIVIGATGLVGSHLVNILSAHENFELIKLFSRRSTSFQNKKIKEFIVDFENPNSFAKELTGDVLFSSMGTTIRTAGSKEAQYKVDFTYQFNIAKAASANGVKDYVLVSSAGANAKSRFFYMRMKGELDEAVKNLDFSNISIIRPASLEGNRKEERSGEKIAIKVTKVLANFLPGLKKYRPIHAKVVARSMIKAALLDNPTKYQIYSYEEVFKLAGE